MKHIIVPLIAAAFTIGCTQRTKIEPAEVSESDQDRLVAAVYQTGIRTNGLSFYYAERYTRGKDSWLHVQFTDSRQTDPAIRPVYDFVQSADGWKVVDKRDE